MQSARLTSNWPASLRQTETPLCYIMRKVAPQGDVQTDGEACGFSVGGGFSPPSSRGCHTTTEALGLDGNGTASPECTPLVSFSSSGVPSVLSGSGGGAASASIPHCFPAGRPVHCRTGRAADDRAQRSTLLADGMGDGMHTFGVLRVV